jgi:hypothetical protein
MKMTDEIKTKWDVYKELKEEFTNALPQIAIDCEVSISEAMYDKCNDERYDGFKEVLLSEFKTYEQGKKDAVKIIEDYKNPYPKDLFLWDNKGKLDFNRGRFNKFCYKLVESIKEDLKKELAEK